MKKFVVLNRILILGAVVFLSGCSLRKNVVPNPKPPVWEENAKMPWTEEENEVRLVQITDPHFYSPSLTDGGERYQKIMENAAGRAALDVEKILESFAKEMKELKPDVLVVSGDMTLNGEKESHREFAAYLEEFERNGIQVLVIPGNHDINNPYARTIRDKEVAKAESITGEDFEAIYRDFGYAEALERDEDSLSYVAEVSENLWVLMLDTCIYRDSHQDTGSLSYHTKKWALNVAEKAGKQGEKADFRDTSQSAGTQCLFYGNLYHSQQPAVCGGAFCGRSAAESFGTYAHYAPGRKRRGNLRYSVRIAGCVAESLWPAGYQPGWGYVLQYKTGKVSGKCLPLSVSDELEEKL